MSDYKIIGLDLAKRKFHFVALNEAHEVVLKKAQTRDAFFAELASMVNPGETFAMEACGGAHYTAQRLMAAGHTVILLKPKDVKPYAKSRQKNDMNDALAICKAAADPNLMRVQPKTKEEQEISYLHKARRNTIRQRIQRSNSLMTALFEFGCLLACGKTQFARSCEEHIKKAYEDGFISQMVYDQMLLDGEEIKALLAREKQLDKAIVALNKTSAKAQRLETIPGIGPVNASILSIKPVHLYTSPKDFAASLGLVPRQNSTGGHITLGGISKQGDRYARTMLIQAGRCLVMRSCKDKPPKDPVFELIARLKKAGKPFNVICVAVANKLARMAYALLTKEENYVAA